MRRPRLEWIVVGGAAVCFLLGTLCYTVSLVQSSRLLARLGAVLFCIAFGVALLPLIGFLVVNMATRIYGLTRRRVSKFKN